MRILIRSNIILFSLLIILLLRCGEENDNLFKCNEESYFCCSENICTSITSIGDDGKAIVILETWEMDTTENTFEWYEGDIKLGSGEILPILIEEGKHDIKLTKNNGEKIIDNITIWVNDKKNYYIYYDENKYYLKKAKDSAYIKYGTNELSYPNYVIINWSEITNNEEIINNINNLKYITFYFNTTEGSVMLPENQFRCKFKEGVDEEWINEFNKTNHIEKMERAPYTEESMNTFVLTVIHKNGLATLLISSIYHENKNTEWAYPHGGMINIL